LARGTARLQWQLRSRRILYRPGPAPEVENMPDYLIEHPIFSFGSALPYNTGLVALRPDSLRADRTTVVAGAARGGTTMVAECLGVLGLPIGVPIPAPPEMFNYEDPEIQAVLHCIEPGPVDLPRLRELVALRNQNYPLWGFKLPMALNSLPLLEMELRSPAFVLVMRDVVAIASRECIATGVDVTDAMRRAMVWQHTIVEFAATSASPCLLVSYEKALQFPEIVATTLARWTGLDASPEACRRAAASIVANRDGYLRGVRQQCDASAVRQPRRWTLHS
jgi:hypothetical protein